jgi:benzoyl-CoA reductase/2-hydroxyglutaryl-CoA dehydratase subunit BcrC/BadD/HgdB
MEILKKIDEINSQTFNSYLKSEKQKGKKILGYFCPYIPEELIAAAGFIPYRMKALHSKGTSLSDAWYSNMNCSFPRNSFDQILQGDYDFLDGIIFMNSCDHTRRMYDNLRASEKDNFFLHFIDVPHTDHDSSKERYIAQLRAFKVALESEFKIKISDEDILKAIKETNERRRKLKEISNLRKREKLPIRGSELLSLMLAITSVPHKEAVYLLDETFNQIQNRNISSPDDVRTMFLGSCFEEVEHFKFIESLGIQIVCDILCLGERYFHSLVDESSDPITALVSRYLTNLSCPRMTHGLPYRLEYINYTAKEYKAQGVLAEKLKFCILYGGEMFVLTKEMKEKNTPFLAVEREYKSKNEGQLKTRLQAFMEQIQDS